MERTSHCIVCHGYLGLLSRRHECSHCKQYICKDHFVIRENSLIRCENCEKSILKHKLFSDYEYHIKALKSDLEYIEKDKQRYKKEIAVKDGIILRLENQLHNMIATHNARLDSIDKKLEEEQSFFKNQEILIEHLEKSQCESVNTEKILMEKLNLYTSELNVSRIEFEEFKSDKDYVSEQVEKLSEELKTKVPISRVKLVACASCYKTVKVHFWEELRQAFLIEGRESLLASLTRASVILPNSLQLRSTSCRCMIV